MEIILKQLPQHLVNGVTPGSVYALIALSYSMVYGILQLLNFAHGEVYMIGAFIGWGIFTLLVPQEALLLPAVVIILLMLVLAMLACGFLGIIIAWFAYRPLREQEYPLVAAMEMFVCSAEGDVYTFSEYRSFLEQAGFIEVAQATEYLIRAVKP